MLLARQALAQRGIPAFGRGFGPLEPKLPLNSADLPSNLRNTPLLAVPKNFDYTAISITGQTMVKVRGGMSWDPAKAGGTTTLVLGARGELVSHYTSIAGTEPNCAGGPTPWGTWLTCEETFSQAERRHGYVFEVPAEGIVTEPQPIIGMGRFSHEAAAVDPATSYV